MTRTRLNAADNWGQDEGVVARGAAVGVAGGAVARVARGADDADVGVTVYRAARLCRRRGDSRWGGRAR